jgi:hypothetical protein
MRMACAQSVASLSHRKQAFLLQVAVETAKSQTIWLSCRKINPASHKRRTRILDALGLQIFSAYNNSIS